MKEMKNSGVPWIGLIPKQWEVAPLWRSLRRRNEDNHPDELVLSLYRDLGVVPKDSRDDNHNVTSLDTTNYKFVRKGDFVINKMKAWQGSMAVSGYQGIVSPAYHVCEFINDKIYPHYLHYLLRNPSYLPEYDRLSTGLRVGQWDLSYDDFKNIPHLIPPYGEQQRIVNFLDRKCADIDNVLEKTKASIEEYRKLKMSIITEAITKGVRGPRPMKGSGIEWIGEIPATWEVRKFKHLGDSWNGLTYSPEDMTDKENGTLVLRSSNIQNGRLAYEDNVYVRGTISNSKMVQKGDILICSRNGSAKLIGKNAIIPDGVVASFGAFMMIYRCVHPEFIKYVLSSNIFTFNLSSFLTATVNQLTTGNFNNIQFCWPDSEEERKEIASYLDQKCSEIDSLIESKERFIKELEAYRKSIIYEYVTGKKEVC